MRPGVQGKLHISDLSLHVMTLTKCPDTGVRETQTPSLTLLSPLDSDEKCMCHHAPLRSYILEVSRLAKVHCSCWPFKNDEPRLESVNINQDFESYPPDCRIPVVSAFGSPGPINDICTVYIQYIQYTLNYKCTHYTCRYTLHIP